MSLTPLLIDFETTGLGKHAKACEVAWIEIDEDLNVVDSDMSLLDPQCQIEAGAAAIHGITNRMVAGAPTADEYFRDVLNGALGQQPLLVVAHNASFDWRFFEPYAHRDTQTMCTLNLARLLYPDAENHKLGTLAYLFDLVDADTRLHSAESDLDVLLKLVRKMATDTGYSIFELAELSRQPNPNQKIGFGKHRGTPLRELPKDYVQWLLTKADIDADLRAALVAL